MALISASELAMFRADAKSEMPDTITIRGASTLGPLNTSTGVRPVILGAVRYTGQGKIQERDVQERDAQGGAHSFVSVRQEIHIPVGAKNPEGVVTKIVAGDVATVDLCPNDPSNNGRIFRIAAPQGKSKATAQRLQVDEIVG